MAYQSHYNTVYQKPNDQVPTYYNPVTPVDSKLVPVPVLQTPPALIPQPPMKSAQTPYERTVGSRIRYAVIAGILFLIFSLPIAYRISGQIWSIFSSIPLMEKPALIPRMIQHPNGYQVQQMVETPGSIGIRGMLLHAGVVTLVMYIILSKSS